MISKVNGTASSAYAAKANDSKNAPKESGSVSKQGDMSKIEQIKEALESGEYKINIQALSQKIADELL